MFIVILCTIDSIEHAKEISKILVNEKLAACVNIINNVNSVYMWEGKIVEDGENLLIIKTKKDLYNKVETKIKELHPYEVPEIISIPVEKGYSKYLNWIEENTLRN